MASIVDDPNGRRRILFIAPDGVRKTVRLGKIDRRAAESVGRHVEELLAAKLAGQPVARPTAAWLANIGAELLVWLAAAGLADVTPTLTVAEYTESAFDEAKEWTPRGGAKSGATGAQNAAQHAPASSRTESQDSKIRNENPVSLQDSAMRCEVILTAERKWMGIEPTGGVVHAPRRF
jgi:hypothetical protein